MSDNINVFFELELKDGFSPTFQKAQAQTDEFKKAFKSAMQEFADDSKKATDSIKQGQDAVVKGQDTMFSKMKSSVGGVMGSFLGLAAMVYTAKKSISDFADFDKYIQKIGIVGHLSKQQMAQLRSDVKNISSEMGADATELAQAGMKLASARVPVEQMKEYLEYAVKVQRGSAEIGKDLALPDIANFMSVLKSNFPNAEAGEMADTMAWMLDNVPNINFLELSNSLAKSAPLAKSLNIGFKELLAIESSAIVNKGGATASTEMRNVLLTLDKMRNEFAKEMKIGNIKFEKEGDLMKHLEELEFKYKNVNRDVRAKSLEKEYGASTGIILNQYLDDGEKIKALFQELRFEAKGFADQLSFRIDGTASDKLKKILTETDNLFKEIGETLNKLMIPDALLMGLKTLSAFTKILGSGFGNIAQGFKSDIADFSKGEYFKDFFSLNSSSAITPIQEKQENKLKLDKQDITITLANNSNTNLRVGNVENTGAGANIEVAKVNYLNK